MIAFAAFSIKASRMSFSAFENCRYGPLLFDFFFRGRVGVLAVLLLFALVPFDFPRFFFWGEGMVNSEHLGREVGRLESRKFKKSRLSRRIEHRESTP